MYLQAFPNIEWIRQTAEQDFSNGKDYQGNTLSSKGWPNVILNVQSLATERDNIKGPFSLFYNLEGKSVVGINKYRHHISDHFYCLSNSGQPFDLHIPDGEQTTTFNIHFGRTLFEDVVQHLFHSQDWALDNFGNINLPAFEILPKTDFMSEALRSKLLSLHNSYQLTNESNWADREYEMTTSILELLLRHGKKELKKMDLVRAQKPATRKELFRRVNIAIDYIHSHEELDLTSVSRNCGLSKFHFIRVFKDIYGKSPTDYMAQLKAKKAQKLLRETDKDLTSIALALGFSELSAFTRFFKRVTGKTPSSMRPSN